MTSTMTARASVTKFTLSIVAILSLSACAPAVIHSPVEMAPIAAAARQPSRVLSNPVNIKLDTGYSRSLPAGSQWTKVGTIQQGDVYKRNQDIFTLEGTHVHEAYLVVAGNRLTGFYLPVERAFSELQQKVDFNFN